MNATTKYKISIYIVCCMFLGGFNSSFVAEMHASEIIPVAVGTQSMVFKINSLQVIALKVAGYLLHKTLPQGRSCEGNHGKKDVDRSSNCSLKNIENRQNGRLDSANGFTALKTGSKIHLLGMQQFSMGKFKTYLVIKIYLYLLILMLMTMLLGDEYAAIAACMGGFRRAINRTQLKMISWVSCFNRGRANGGRFSWAA